MSLIILNGFPGTGKLTIMRRVQALLPGSLLLDNHLLIDPVQAVLPGRGPEHHELRRAVRAPVFGSMRKTVMSGGVVLMTACLSAADTDVAQEHLDIVVGTSATLIWVNATCDWDVLEQRVQSPDRRAKSKLTDATILHDMVTQHTLFATPGAVTLDTTGNIDHTVQRLVDIIHA
jgi:predicted kinase